MKQIYLLAPLDKSVLLSANSVTNNAGVKNIISSINVTPEKRGIPIYEYIDLPQISEVNDNKNDNFFKLLDEVMSNQKKTLYPAVPSVGKNNR